MHPNFIVVGASKSGTTSLYYYLKQHPDVFMSPDKEPHYFAPAKWCSRAPATKEEYEQLFEGAEQYKAIGESSTGYLYYEDSAQRIHREIPRCRIVILLRNPVDRAFSGYCHEVREGMEHVSFAEALREEQEQGLRVIAGGDFSFNYIRQGFVCKLVKQYRELFGADRVHVCLYDDFVADPHTVLRRLFRFLEIDETFRGNWSYRYNPSGIPRIGWLHEAVDGLDSETRWPRRMVRTLFPAAIRDYCWHRIRDWNVRAGKAIEFDPRTRQFLQETFKIEIANIEDLLGRDLSHWKS